MLCTSFWVLLPGWRLAKALVKLIVLDGDSKKLESSLSVVAAEPSRETKDKETIVCMHSM